MTTAKYPKSPNEKTQNGMVYFPRMLDKIRLQAIGELPAEYLKNLGSPMAADGACCNFLRVDYADLRDRVLEGGTDEEILEWCFEKGRRLNEGDIVVWNGFASKLGWRDFMSPRFQKLKEEQGIADRHDIACVPDLMDFEEGRLK
jgi:Domain of unknown function (DUF5069)